VRLALFGVPPKIKFMGIQKIILNRSGMSAICFRQNHSRELFQLCEAPRFFALLRWNQTCTKRRDAEDAKGRGEKDEF
jgi:hypothetical protein